MKEVEVKYLLGRLGRAEGPEKILASTSKSSGNLTFDHRLEDRNKDPIGYLTACQLLDHPNESVNQQIFRLSSGSRWLHYENGLFHLFFCNGMYYLSRNHPDTSRCLSRISATELGALPVGKHLWDILVDGRWIQLPVTVKQLSDVQANPKLRTSKIVPEDVPAVTEIDCSDIIQPLRVKNDEKPILLQDPSEEIFAMCKDMCCKFKDSAFPPVQRSLATQEHAYRTVVGWKRWYEIRGASRLFDDFTAGDVAPSSALSNRYVAASLASIAAARAELLRAAFGGRSEANEFGCYVLRLFDLRTDLWVYVVVDDYFPITRHDEPAFLQCKTRSNMWCSLLEKAFAKLAGSYASIDVNISPLQLLRPSGEAGLLAAVSGAPTTTRCLCGVASSELWDELRLAVGSRWPLVAGCDSFQKDQNGKLPTVQDGVACGSDYDYAIFGAFELNGQRLVRIANPLGRPGWRGKWQKACMAVSNKQKVGALQDNLAPSFLQSSIQMQNKFSCKANLAKIAADSGVGHKRNDCGMFLLPFEDFCTNFDHFTYAPVRGDKVWDRYLKLQTEALAEQASGCLYFYGFPNESIRNILKEPFILSKPASINGKPHYQSGRLHLYYAAGNWVVSQKLDPKISSCISFAQPSWTGAVPEGTREWVISSSGVRETVLLSVVWKEHTKAAKPGVLQMVSKKFQSMYSF